MAFTDDAVADFIVGQSPTKEKDHARMRFHLRYVVVGCRERESRLPRVADANRQYGLLFWEPAGDARHTAAAGLNNVTVSACPRDAFRGRKEG